MKLRLKIFSIYISLFGLPGLFVTARAAPGDLDPTFSEDGFTFELIGKGADDAAYATAIQPDGKIVLAGKAIYGTHNTCSVSRFNPNGSLDPSFNRNGKAFVTLNYSFTCQAVAIQSDGKIVAAGYTDSVGSGGYGAIVRFNSNGTPDTSFDNDGIVTNFQVRRFYAVVIQPNGKVVAAGHSGSDGTEDFAVVRLNTNGTPDTSFDDDGLVTTPVFNNSDVARALVLQPDGKIIAAGNGHSGINQDYALVRYNPDGSLDTSFNGNGKVTTNIAFSDIVNAVVLQPDGKIVAGGYSGGTSYFSVARYNPNGSLDTSFDGDGIATTSILVTGDLAYGIAIQSDGKIVQAGYSGTGSGTNVSLVRYNPNGSLDNTFNGNGKISTPVLNFTDYAFGVAIQTDGKIVAAGYARHPGLFGGTNNDSILVRYNPDGTLDSSFDGDGILGVDVAIDRSGATDVALQTDGKIVALGFSFDDWRGTFTLVRYNPDGSLDTSFNGDGKVTTTFGDTYNYANSLAIQPDGKIVAAGYNNDGNTNFAVARYNTDGSLDTSFDGDGMVTTPVLSTNYGNCVAIQANGKIVVAGRSTYSTGGDAGTVVRYNPDGSLDTSFNGSGKLTAASPSVSSINDLAILANGKILVAGQSQGVGGQPDFALIQYNENGTPDTSFGNGGRVTTPVSVNFADSIGAITTMPDGKILALGSNSDPNLPGSLTIVRYHPNGSVDTSFGNAGKIFSTFGTSGASGDIEIQPDGKILATGIGGIVRFNANGTVNTAFGAGGVAGFSNFGGSSFVLDSSGRIVIGGSADAGFFAVGRVLTTAIPSRAPFDFDGDQKSDISIFRPGTGQWWINQSGSNQTSAIGFGLAADKIVPGDYTGDGKADIAVWRPSNGEWFILRSQNYSFYSIPFGTTGDVPVPADYDGDGETDIAVYRPSSFTWYIRNSSGGTNISVFGAVNDVPVPGDYDGDGKTDIAIYRPSDGQWWINRSTAGVIAVQFGASTDKTVPGDYTGDGKTDIAIWRPSTGEWFILRSEDFSYYAFPFGTAGDVPVPGDYDGDGKIDASVFRPSDTTWYLNRSTSGVFIMSFGASGDKPVPSAFIP